MKNIVICRFSAVFRYNIWRTSCYLSICRKDSALFMDVYMPSQEITGKRPCVLYVLVADLLRVAVSILRLWRFAIRSPKGDLLSLPSIIDWE